MPRTSGECLIWTWYRTEATSLTLPARPWPAPFGSRASKIRPARRSATETAPG